MSYRDRILAYVDRQDAVYRQIALDIHARPEVSNYEFFACETLSGQLAKEGFAVTTDVAGHRGRPWSFWRSTTRCPASAMPAAITSSARPRLSPLPP